MCLFHALYATPVLPTFKGDVSHTLYPMDDYPIIKSLIIRTCKQKNNHYENTHSHAPFYLITLKDRGMKLECTILPNTREK